MRDGPFMSLKTTWDAGEGKMRFYMPDRSQVEVDATTIDHPNTMCEALDRLYALNARERELLIGLAKALIGERR